MLAPVVIPLAGNLATAINFAERANHASENRFRLAVDELQLQETTSLAKMDKQMLGLKQELTRMKAHSAKRMLKKDGAKKSHRTKVIKVMPANNENADPKQKTGDLMTEKIPIIHRRLSLPLVVGIGDTKQRVPLSVFRK